jgi:hypothetical protein
MTATDESLIYEGINERNRSYNQRMRSRVFTCLDVSGATFGRPHPAVSQSCSLTVRSSMYIVLDKKSIPVCQGDSWICPHLWLPDMCCQMCRTSGPQQQSHTPGLPLTKRVIRLVFPTLCSPRNTSLNFFKGLLLDV